jgi:chromosome partitioning protein
MRTIAFLSQKGGSGKTTLAVHTAVAAEESGEKVFLIDTDPQGSSQAWSQARNHDIPPVHKAIASNIRRIFEQAVQQKATLIVIDTAPHATPGVDVIAASADFLLIPCRPSAFDLVAIASSVQVAKAAGKPAAFIMNACPARAPEVEETREVLEAVTEFDAEGKAAEEITKLWKWIRKQIGGKHGS